MNKAQFTDSNILKIVKALKNDNNALTIFLNSFENKNLENNKSKNINYSDYTNDEHNLHINTALNITNKNLKHELILKNDNFILSTDECNNITDITIEHNFWNYDIFEYYKFVKLERLTIKEENKHICIALLNKIFNDTSFYPSLIKISFYNNIYQEYNEIIQNYFIQKMTFVRHMTQMSGIYNCYAIFIDISLVIPKNIHNSYTNQQLLEIYLHNIEEKYIHYKTKNIYTVKYRIGERSMNNMPIIFNTHVDYFI